MSIKIQPAGSGDFAAVIEGVDVRETPSASLVREIVSAINRYAVLVFRDQDIDDDQQVAFALGFGPMEDRLEAKSEASSRLAKTISDISNIDENGVLLAAADKRRRRFLVNQIWHSDSSYRPIPASYSFLSGRQIPTTGSDTEFADMRAAYHALDARTKGEIEDLMAVHDMSYTLRQLGFPEEELANDPEFEQVRKVPPIHKKLVLTHPLTGRKALFLGSGVSHIAGWHQVDGRSLIRDLSEHAVQRQFVHTHKWRPKDFLMWDNRQNMHRGRPYDMNQLREMHRICVSPV